jgi:hypothetical protein
VNRENNIDGNKNDGAFVRFSYDEAYVCKKENQNFRNWFPRTEKHKTLLL